jgi:hypothetical protein
MTTDFEIVTDDLRTAPPSSNDPKFQAMLEGKTIFVPGQEPNRLASFYSRAKRSNRKLRTRQMEVGGKKGIVMWLDEPDPESG